MSEQGTNPTWRNVVRREFSCKVVADVRIGVEQETGKVYGHLYGAALNANNEPIPVPSPMDGTPCEGGGTFEMADFVRTLHRQPTEQDLAAWAEDIFAFVNDGLPVLLAAVAIEYPHCIRNLIEAKKDPNRWIEDDYDEEDVIKDMLAQVEYYLRALLAKPNNHKRQRRPRGQWTTPELREAVNGILRTLKPAQKTWARVAVMLKEKEPNRAPANGEALRQLCRRHELKFRSLRELKGKRKTKRNADAK